MLPETINIRKAKYFLTMTYDKQPHYENMSRDTEIHYEIADSNDNEANARAKMLIYLYDNGMIKNE